MRNMRNESMDFVIWKWKIELWYTEETVIDIF